MSDARDSRVGGGVFLPWIYVVGLEPANWSVLGSEVDRAAGVLPMLEPVEARTTELRILFRPVPGAA
jgi:hypothetical protein